MTRPPRKAEKILRWTLEILFPVLLAYITAGTAMNRLEDWHGPAGSLSNDLFIPAILMNAGMGFSSVDPSDVPGLRAFLDFQTDRFDIADIPPSVTLLPADPYQSFHRYLLYSLALTWRLAGVSWDAVKILLCFLLCLTVLLAFFVSRIAMNAFFSFLVGLAFLYAPPVLMTLPILRDFAKAPFILALLLLLGITVKYRLSPFRYLFTAALAGMVLGIGMGFRREMLIFIPICAAFLLISRLTPSLARSLPLRAAAVLVFFAVFLASAWPIHRALATHGYVAAHDTIMGFSSDSDHEIGLLKPASYEKHYLYNDLYATLKAHDAAERGISRTAPYHPGDDLVIKRDYVRALAHAFPADMLTRAYASVLRLASGVFPTRNRYFSPVEQFGLWFMMLSFVLLAAQSPWKAWLLLILVCWFCGYTSLQFGLRHVFHMCFVPYWFAGFAAQTGMVLLKKAFAGEAVLKWNRAGRAVAYAAGWWAATLFAFWATFGAAGLVQQSNVVQMAHAYGAAERVPIAHRLQQWEGRGVLSPDLPAACRTCEASFSIDTIHNRVLVARFSGLPAPLNLFLLYEWEHLPWDFSGRLSLNWREAGAPTDVTFYIPVHEAAACGDTSAFAGIVVDAPFLAHFEGFYELTDLKEAPLLVAMAVPGHGRQLLTHQQLVIPWRSQPWRAVYRPYFQYDLTDPASQMETIRAKMTGGDAEAALEAVSEALAERPDSVQLNVLHAKALLAVGRPDEAHEVVSHLIEHHPDNFMLFSMLDRLFKQYQDPETLLFSWEVLATEYDENCLIENYRANALRER